MLEDLSPEVPAPELLKLEALELESLVLAENDIHIWLLPRPSTVSPALLALTTAANKPVHKECSVKSGAVNGWLAERCCVRAWRITPGVMG